MEEFFVLGEQSHLVLVILYMHMSKCYHIKTIGKHLFHIFWIGTETFKHVTLEFKASSV